MSPTRGTSRLPSVESSSISMKRTFGADSGGEGSAPCQGVQCLQKKCGGGGDTTVTGTMFAPNGKLPLYNAIVYVPNSKSDPLTKSTTCDRCGAVTGNPVVSAITDSSGTSTLKNVPVGKDIPLVIRIGKWRRQVTIPTVAECTETPLNDPELTRLPKKQGGRPTPSESSCLPLLEAHLRSHPTCSSIDSSSSRTFALLSPLRECRRSPLGRALSGRLAGDRVG